MPAVRLFLAILYSPGDRLSCAAVALFAVLALPSCGAAQDRYVGRWDVFNGFTYLESPAINLAERGYHLQVGYNLKPWYALGFDYSEAHGTLNLIPRYTPKSLQDQINALLVLLPGYNPAIVTDVHTQTFTLGPAIVIRRFPHMAIILHPSIGAVRELATPHPADAFASLLVKEFISGNHKLDWQGFYGAGGGFDLRVTKHMSVRMHTDVVWDHLFNDILRDGRWTVRASIGPSFHFGKNIAQ